MTPNPTDRHDETAIRRLFQELEESWRRGDADGYASCFTDDADYVVFDGTRLRGRAENARAHRQLYVTVLAGSRLEGAIESVAFLAEDVALVHAVGGVAWPWQDEPSPRGRSRQTMVVVRRDGRWLVRAFQNTRLRPLPELRPGSWGVRLFRAWVRVRTRLARRTAGSRRLLSARAGVVEAPIELVAAAVERSFQEAQPQAQAVEADDARRTFAIQGGWWFRGECQLHPHPRGTLVVYRVLDVAATARWMVPLVLWQYRLSGQLDGMFDPASLLRALGARTASAAYAVAPGACPVG